MKQANDVNRKELTDKYNAVRQQTEAICRPLETEDYVIQSIDDVSPPKWHLGHTTWFFEQVILEEFLSGYKRYHPEFYFVFNSYYESFGERVLRSRRGTLSRPLVRQVYDYRREIDRRMLELFESVEEPQLGELARLTTLGINHEQQHQELLVTDIKHILADNPLRPVYLESEDSVSTANVPDVGWVPFEGGLHEFGAAAPPFAYDNESPRHQAWVGGFRMADRPVTCGEYLEFIEGGGYKNSLLWLSDGWDTVQSLRWTAPLYWEQADDTWLINTLTGFRAVRPEEPVCHVSFYEAAAYAGWAGKRLPTEFEWELAVRFGAGKRLKGNFLESGRFHPAALDAEPPDNSRLRQVFGDVWEWTNSAYLPYPGYLREQGALGEYNGKFMSNQMVLRGGSCATPQSHIRDTYRNFFQCDKRWQFTGIRMACDV
ncbi:MAG: ergothioneine biosynthesis protein EgtB [bacterium]|nr:ergothioneine biosynthesis protein EgtB [bacterium]